MDMIDKVFGVSPQVLAVRSRRTEMISANLANADTPGYKARDIDFSQAMAAAKSERGGLQGSDRQHLGVSSMKPEMLYRMPSQPSLDGNTVETNKEHAEFMENAIRYQASLDFLNGRIKSMLLAFRGE